MSHWCAPVLWMARAPASHEAWISCAYVMDIYIYTIDVDVCESEDGDDDDDESFPTSCESEMTISCLFNRTMMINHRILFHPRK